MLLEDLWELLIDDAYNFYFVVGQTVGNVVRMAVNYEILKNII